jgi:hypothetical protein
MMADPNITVETYENGQLVDSQTVAKPVEQFNRESIEENALAALADNKAYIDLASPTTAQAGVQIKALTRQMNGLIRLLLDRLDDTE